MKKLVFILIISIVLTTELCGQTPDVNSCIESYNSQKTMGYNALAVAIDNGFFVCGYAFGQPAKKYADRQALGECERARLDPANEVQGIRKIMTRCRIMQYQLVE